VNKEFLLGGLVMLLDQSTKVVFESNILNSGGVFGVGEGASWIVFSLISLIFVGVLLSKSVNVNEKYGLTIIFASGLSNLIDRIILGGVRDFIFWPILNVYGNVADLLLTLGVVIVSASVFSTWQKSGVK
jgi:lipoprotein signal peptidase